MGSGRWSAKTYAGNTSAKRAAGTPDFAYSHTTTSSKPRHEWRAHDDLNPKGVKVRESRDSDEHPTSLAIAVLFDVTGSMHRIPQVLQKKLPELYGLILRKGYVEHPQVMFGAIGDATCDMAPLQVGQFESDNRADADLAKILLEGGGGGGNHESYQLAAYFMARHTATDCWEKRGKRGYLFIIGDERAYAKVSRREVEAIIGSTIQEDIETKDVVAELLEKWDVYFLFASQGSYQPEEVITAAADGTATGWRDLLGQNAIVLEDADAVCETIALTIGLGEGAIDDLDEGLGHLEEIGSTSGAAVSKALAHVGSGGGAVSTTEAPEGLGGDEGVDRA